MRVRVSPDLAKDVRVADEGSEEVDRVHRGEARGREHLVRASFRVRARVRNPTLILILTKVRVRVRNPALILTLTSAPRSRRGRRGRAARRPPARRARGHSPG